MVTLSGGVVNPESDRVVYSRRIMYLSDGAYDSLKRGAGLVGLTVSEWVEWKWVDWVTLEVVIKDGSMVELIEAREHDVEMRHSDSVVERGDVRRPAYRTPLLYDGVVYRAMFGEWARRGRNLMLSDDCVEGLSVWVMDQGVVRRRAASRVMLAAQGLELVGRGWVSG